MIYFDIDKNAYGFEIENYIATTTDEIWANFAGTDKWDIVDGEFVDITNTQEYQQKQAQQRQADFEKDFISTQWGWYRKQPQGYANAPQSVDIILNMVNAMQGLTEQISNLMIFYAQPDFADPAQCTEEWLIANQSHPEPCTVAEFMAFYIDFQTRWANEQYRIAQEAIMETQTDEVTNAD